MIKACVTIFAVASTAAAFTPTRISSRSFGGRLAAAEVEAVVAEAPAEVVEPVEEVVEKVLGFCNGYVGGEGPEPMPGTPTGTSVNFDPAGFAERSPEWLPWYREAELKHGRAAMLATLGFVVPEFIRVPGEQFSFESVPNVIDAHDACPEQMIQIMGWISIIEACTFAALANMNNFDREPGDFSFDPLGLFPKDPEKQKLYRLAELKNGRLAMIAIGGMVTGAAISGRGFPYF